nr:MAG TPA: hypothetical protein [Caudoviricetes sp.]
MKTELFVIIASVIAIGLNVISMGPSIMNIMDGYNLKMSYALLCTNISLIIIAIILSYVAVSLKNNK